MDDAIAAARQSLAVGEPLVALPYVALRDDPPALALRGDHINVLHARIGRVIGRWHGVRWQAPLSTGTGSDKPPRPRYRRCAELDPSSTERLWPGLKVCCGSEAIARAKYGKLIQKRAPFCAH